MGFVSVFVGAFVFEMWLQSSQGRKAVSGKKNASLTSFCTEEMQGRNVGTEETQRDGRNAGMEETQLHFRMKDGKNAALTICLDQNAERKVEN
ncbi:hypothetical protein U1Q18_009729 [Sarracenia purpurea var. burkii]